MPKYLIEKHAEPEAYGDDYASNLKTLSRPNDFELLANESGRVVEAREMTYAEAALISRRQHIKAVELDQTAYAVEPDSISSAVRVSAKDAAAVHRIDKVAGRGAGRLIAVIDTGILEALYERHKARVTGRFDVFTDEDWRDLKSMHGSYCISAILGNATDCNLLSYKGLSTFTGSGSYSGIIDCIEDAVERGVTDISLSLGGPVSDILDGTVNAAAAKGVNVFVASGNDQRGNSVHNANKSSPARASGAICVAAVDSNERVADFSNIGSAVDIAGIGVVVQCPDSDLIPDYMSGTSMATPYVCATAVCAGVSGKEIVQSARNTGEPAIKEGSGIADAEKAVEKATPPGQEEPTKSGLWKIQVGAFSIKANAVVLGKELTNMGYPTYLIFEEE